MSVKVAVGVTVTVLVAVLVGGADAATLRINCGLLSDEPSLLRRLTAVALVEVMAKLTRPLPVTREVTSADNQMPVGKLVGENGKRRLPKPGWLLYFMVVSSQ